MFDAVAQGLDSRELAADAIVAHRQDALRVGAERLVLAAHWCDLHPADLDRHGARRAGADGTPEVSDFAAEELGVYLGVHTHTAWVLMADAVNLRHRHPALWHQVLAGEVIDWVARKTATKTSAAQLTLAKALERFVRTGQANEHGIGTLVARATGGDIVCLIAVVNRIAAILEQQGDDDLVDVRRSKALGILADPARALAILEWTPTAQPAAPTPSAKAVLHLHLSGEALRTKHRVARIEELGPILLSQVAEFLRHTNVIVKPVIDLAGGMPVDCYEIPDRMHQVTKLRHPYEVFPWGTIGSRHADDDHSTPYKPPDHGGPPGQTHPDNLGPLSRRHHRVKTHAPGWRHHQIHPGTYLWRTGTGHWYRVNHTGTHHLGKHISPPEEQLRALVNAP